MKKFYSGVALLLLLFTNSYAQNDCSTPYPFITGTTYSYTTITGTPNTDTTNAYGCLATQSNVRWIYVGACMPGDFNLTINVSGGTSTSDVDFIAYGPLGTVNECGLDSTKIIACSFGGGSSGTIDIIGALPGQYYKIMISDTAGLPETVSISQVNGTGVACDSTTINCAGVPVYAQAICKVSADPVLNRNFISWDKNPAFTGTYNIQKETTTSGVFATIAAIAGTDTSVYADTISNPMIQSFSYRIVTSDTCGNSVIASPHNTIHLLTSLSTFNGFPQLIWNPYVGFSYGTYYIYRGSSPATLSSYDSISATFISYTDVAPVPGLSYYMVCVNPPVPCSPSRATSDLAFSNTAPAFYTGINESEFSNLSIGPNPASDLLNFSFGNVSPNVRIDIIDVTGRVVVSKAFKNIHQDVISLNDVANGSYMVRFSSENGTCYKNIVIVK